MLLPVFFKLVDVFPPYVPAVCLKSTYLLKVRNRHPPVGEAEAQRARRILSGHVFVVSRLVGEEAEEEGHRSPDVLMKGISAVGATLSFPQHEPTPESQKQSGGLR